MMQINPALMCCRRAVYSVALAAASDGEDIGHGELP